MKYKIKPYKFDAFEYDPHDLKPQWFLDMVISGDIREYLTLSREGVAYAEIKTSTGILKAYVGYYITYDEFERVDVIHPDMFVFYGNKLDED
jgi:hypothetical protein